MPFHGTEAMHRTFFAPKSTFYEGRFGRIFRNLPSFEPADTDLKKLADRLVEPDKGDFDNPAIPAGYTYLGQFIDHDITFDPRSDLDRQNDPDSLQNFRTPRYDLDCVYGEGPADEPFMYQKPDFVKLLIGQNNHGEDDLPRNKEGTALIGEKRNDENTIVSQLQLAFLKFHNAAMDHVKQRSKLTGADLFREAQRLTRWHYQWVVIHDFLKRIVAPNVVDALLPRPNGDCPTISLCFYKPRYRAFMPVEFSVAAYRFGHSMVRPTYSLSDVVRDRPIFSPVESPGEFDDLRGFRPLAKQWTIDWSFFFETKKENKPQLSRKIDALLAPGLARLAMSVDPERRSLAFLNLRRGKALGLPSGQAVAKVMGQKPLSNQKLGLLEKDFPSFYGEAPLWYYVLKEAELRENGNRLGAVGGRIVAEVFIGLLADDRFSYLRVNPFWEPELPKQGDQFTMPDLLRFAGVA